MELRVWAGIGRWYAEGAGIKVRADTREGAIQGFRDVWERERDPEETERFEEQFEIVVRG